MKKRTTKKRTKIIRRKPVKRKSEASTFEHSRHIRRVQHTVLIALLVLVEVMWSLLGFVLFLGFPQGENLAKQFSKYGLLQLPKIAYADTAGPNTLGTAGTATGWTNVSVANLNSDNNTTYAVCSGCSTTNYAKLTNFGFSIPSTATISGISVTTNGNGAGSTAARRQYRIGLSKNGTATVGTVKTAQQFATTDSNVTSGSGSDLWGTTWTYSEVNASTFGVFYADNDSTTHALNFDYVTVTVTYTVPADPTWVTGSTNFSIYESSSTTWGAGTLRCSGTLTDDNAATVSCGSGTIRASTQYRVELTLKNAGGSAMVMTGAEGVAHYNVKNGWAGTSPTLGACSFNDVGGDDASAVCAASFSTNNVAIAASSGTVTIADTTGTEGFAYLITTGSDPATSSTSYADVSIDSLTENSSKVTITADTTAPTITSVSSDKANGTYKAGEVIDIDVTFSEAVTSTGNVTVTLETGVTDQTCTFTVSNATTGTCNYTVQAGDTSSDLDATISGTIADNGGNSMSNYTPATGLAANKALVIDTTAPTISSVSPSSSTSINNITSASDVSYTLSEAIASGSITMTRTGGTADGSSPRTCTLVGTALNSGAHNAFDMSNTTNGCSVSQSLVDGAIYSFAFNATDAAGNAATTVTSTSVTYDTTAPSISSTAPATSALINNITTSSDVSYTLSEAIASGSIVITRTSGTADASSPHTCNLIGTALNSGAHTAINLSDTTNGCNASPAVGSLVTGAVYSFAFSATDLAENAASTVTNTSITYDGTPPSFSSVSPSSSTSINSITTSSDVSYTLSEAIASGSITMTRTGGTADASSPRTCTLVGTALNSGAHSAFDLSNTTNGCSAAQSLVDGTIYTFTFNGTDAAGNAATTITRTSVTYDVTAPVISATTPATDGYFNNYSSASDVGYTLSEAITSGSIRSDDGDLLSTCTLVGTAKNSGAHASFDMTNTTNGCSVAAGFADGVIYTITYNATDLAGNTATPVVNTNVLFDTSSPTLGSTSPTDEATGVGISDNLTMNFIELLQVGTGNVVIKKFSDNSIFETIDITSGQVSGWGTATLTINPTGSFANNTAYYVQVDSTAILDLAGNAYAGINNNSTWNFTTVAGAGVLGYESSGYLVSQSIDLANYPTVAQRNALRATWSQTIPTGCALTLKFRGTNAGGSPPDYSGEPWGSATSYSGTGSTVTKDLSGDSALQGRRYFQYRVDFTNCTTNSETPTLNDIKIDFD